MGIKGRCLKSPAVQQYIICHFVLRKWHHLYSSTDMDKNCRFAVLLGICVQSRAYGSVQELTPRPKADLNSPSNVIFENIDDGSGHCKKKCHRNTFLIYFEDQNEQKLKLQVPWHFVNTPRHIRPFFAPPSPSHRPSARRPAAFCSAWARDWRGRTRPPPPPPTWPTTPTRPPTPGNPRAQTTVRPSDRGPRKTQPNTGFCSQCFGLLCGFVVSHDSLGRRVSPTETKRACSYLTSTSNQEIHVHNPRNQGEQIISRT